MAGQGLNLGISDAQCLVQNIANVVHGGMTIRTADDNDNNNNNYHDDDSQSNVGSQKHTAGLEYALQQYESERQREVLAVMAGIQFLHNAFGIGNDICSSSSSLSVIDPVAVYARSLGMNMVNMVGPVRRGLVRIASGRSGVFR